jgi:class 3 adenylate cyclase
MTTTYETARFKAAFRSVEGLREYFRAKEESGDKTIVLFSELCFSTQYKDQRGFIEGMFKSFSCNEKVSRIMKEYDGIVIKTNADCIMVKFDTNKQNQGKLSTNAMNAAIRLQELFEDLNIGVSDDIEKYRIKIGISIGVTGESYAGDPHGLSVDIAARLTSLAKPEQILVTKDLVNTANIKQIESRSIEPPLRIKPQDMMGQTQKRKLKGIEDPVSVCEIKWDGKERGIQESQ